MSKEKLLINDPKSNNSEDMSNKQIEEMATKIQYLTASIYADAKDCAEALYNAGYRKQSEGEWIDSLKGYCQCSNCRTSFETLPTTFMFKLNNRFCRNCGAKMKGGAK